MPTLRQIVDGKTLECQAASPAAKHVADHIQDPFGKTKGGMDELNQARMDYETKKQNMRMQLAPVEQVVQGIKNMHQLDGPGDGSPLDMSPNNPANMPQQPQIDPQTGLPIPQTPNAPGAQIDESTGVPQNMQQTPGQQMNSNRPSQAGFQPGVSPGPAESVRPGKMGTPQPGQANVSKVAGNPNPTNMPAGWTKPGSGGTGNQPGQYNKGAVPPKGNRTLPGAKGPGDPKVANRTKKAQGNSQGAGRPVHVEVRADSNMVKSAVSTVARAAASDALRHPMVDKTTTADKMKGGAVCPKCGKVHAKGMKACNNMKAGGPGSGRRPGYRSSPGMTGMEKALKHISDSSHTHGQKSEKPWGYGGDEKDQPRPAYKTTPMGNVPPLKFTGGVFPSGIKANERAKALGLKARMANLTQ